MAEFILMEMGKDSGVTGSVDIVMKSLESAKMPISDNNKK